MNSEIYFLPFFLRFFLPFFLAIIFSSVNLFYRMSNRIEIATLFFFLKNPPAEHLLTIFVFTIGLALDILRAHNEGLNAIADILVDIVRLYYLYGPSRLHHVPNLILHMS
jgi:hypothetical protein